MSAQKKVLKAVMIAVAVFIGFTTVAFAAYYVYEHKEELPILKNFFEEEEPASGPRVEEIEEEATIAPTWVINIENGNIVKIQQNGSKTVLVDKDDYDDVEYFSDVSVSPDYQHMCFLAHAFIPVWMDYAKTDGSDVTQTGLAENCYWSNDSTMIAYTNHTTDVSPHDVYVHFLSTDESTNFTEHLSTEHVMRVYENPVWSDDDTTITSLFNSYDDQNDWAQTTGFSIITIATGDVQDVASNVDTSDWTSFEHEASGISLLYPPGWTAAEDCTGAVGAELCSIKVTNDEYIWLLGYDPFVTGGGFGFLFDQIDRPSTEIRTHLSIDGYTPYLLTYYYNGGTLAVAMDNDTIPKDEELWGWSVTFTDPDVYSGLGFGPGEMYDDSENNFWSITYKYNIVFPNEGAKDFSDVPLKGDTNLDEAILIMNAITESVQLPE